jgi:hypothetical protein
MTEDQERQIRAILEIEGFSAPEIESLVEDFRRKPDQLHEALSKWKLVTETKQ